MKLPDTFVRLPNKTIFISRYYGLRFGSSVIFDEGLVWDVVTVEHIGCKFVYANVNETYIITHINNTAEYYKKIYLKDFLKDYE